MKDAAPLRPVIIGTLVACLLVAVAPWLSGGQDMLARVMADGALLLGALLVWRQPAVRRLTVGPLVVVWGLFMAFALASVWWSVDRYASGVWVAQWLMAGVAFWLSYTVAGEVRGRVWFVRGYVVSAVGFAVVAVWMYLTGSYDRLTGSFYWANPAAAYLMPAIVLSVDRWRMARGRPGYWWLGAAGVLLASFWLADSRGATLVLVMVMGLYLVIVPTHRRFWTTFVLMMGMSLGGSFGLVSLSKTIAHHSASVVPGSRLAEVATGESKSARDRWAYLGSALEMWYAHPVAGTGAGTYGDVHPQYQQRVVSASTNAHNLYVQVLAELGLVGAMLLAAVLLCVVVGVVKGFIVRPETLAVLLGAGTLLLHFGLDIDAEYPALLMLAAVLLGLVYRQRREHWSGASWRPAAVSVAVLVAILAWYQNDVWARRAEVDQRDGDYGVAAEHFGMAQAGWVFNPDYVNAEGINLYTLGVGGGSDAPAALKLALDRAREAERLDPRDGQHHQLEGRVLMAQGNAKDAEAAFREALRLDRLNHPDYALDLALVQLAQGDRQGAVRTARAMLALYPDGVVEDRSADASVRPAVANLEALVGNVALQEGRLREAEAAARRAVKVYPDSLRGRALLRQVEMVKHGSS